MTISIEKDGKLYGLIIPASYNAPGLTFFTPDDFSQQLAFMRHPAGKSVAAHLHRVHVREVRYTQEVLFVRKGKVRIDFYDDEKAYLESRVLTDGDVVLLAGGGHGVTMIEETEMVEVKQGPYAGDEDKVRFNGIAPNGLRIGGAEGEEP